MISYITGVLGAGKTFHGVRLAMDHLAKGGTVVTNVECCFERIQKMIALRSKVFIQQDQLRVFDPETTPEWESVIPWGESEGVVLVLLDEAQLFYCSRDWAQTAAANKRLLSFLSQSRKAGVDVIWITQEGENVDKQFRVLAEWELAIVSTAHLPLGWIGKLPFRAYIVKHVSAKSRNVVSRKWWSYDKWLFGLYRTDSFLSGRMQELSEGVERVTRRDVPKVSTWHRLKLSFRFALDSLPFRKTV